MPRLTAQFALLLALLISALNTQAHCQIPCGIYDDPATFKLLKQDVETLSKSVNELIDHSDDKGIQAVNQQIRWVMNKEKYADQIIFTMTDYFLTQRIKPSNKHYQAQLEAAHTIILLAVTTKQTVDKEVVKKLNDAVDAFEKAYNLPAK